MEKTPVEFLVELLNNLNDNFSLAFKEEINQANKMFEDQIINAYNDGSIDTLKDQLRLGRQYYRKTFNK